MKRLLLSAAIAAAVGFSAVPVFAAPATLEVKLAALNDSGETGTATLKDTDGGLVVTLTLKGGNSEGPQPAHIHKGTCEKLDPKPTYPLASVAKGASSTTVKDVTVADLLKGTYAINVHKSTTEAATYVACGNIVAPAAK